MLKKFIELVIITLLSVVSVNAQSQGPTPGPTVGGNPPQIHTPDKQQPPEADKRGTEQSPLVVKTINPPKTQAEIDQKRKEHEEKTAVDRSLVRYTGILAIFTAILAFFTIILAGISYWQGRLTKRALTSTQRAFVFLKDIDINPVRGSREVVVQWKFSPRLENSGNTPTKNMFVSINCDIFEDKLTDDHHFAYTVQKDMPIMIGPKAEVWSKPFYVYMTEIEKVYRGIGHLYIWGMAEYNDVFNKRQRHRTCFCYKLIIERDEVPLIAMTSFFQSTKYNYAD
jgi:hypothetical protein